MLVGLIVLFAGFVWWAWENHHRRTHPVPPGLREDIRLPHRQEFELYHNPLSLCSMKVRFCLSELRIPYASHPVDLIETGAYENIRRPFLSVNPGGTVPVLVHRGHPVYESHEQIRYAAAHAPAGCPDLVPADPEARACMEKWVELSSLTGDPLNEMERSAGNAIPALTVPIFAAMMEKIPTWKILEGLLFHFDKRRPVMFLIFKFMGIEGLEKLAPVGKVLARGRRQMDEHLDALEEQLESSGGPWIVGSRFSLADVSWLAIFERLRQVDALERFFRAGARPACAAYWERLRERPAYREAILDRSHPLIEYGTRRIREAKAASAGVRTLLEGSRDFST